MADTVWLLWKKGGRLDVFRDFDSAEKALSSAKEEGLAELIRIDAKGVCNCVCGDYRDYIVPYVQYI